MIVRKEKIQPDQSHSYLRTMNDNPQHHHYQHPSNRIPIPADHTSDSLFVPEQFPSSVAGKANNAASAAVGSSERLGLENRHRVEDIVRSVPISKMAIKVINRADSFQKTWLPFRCALSKPRICTGTLRGKIGEKLLEKNSTLKPAKCCN